MKHRLGLASLLLGLFFGCLLPAAPVLEPANPKQTPKVEIPGGSLEAHERAGGHLIERHVGKTADQLRQRLQSETRISAASSFTDKKSAETAVAAATAANQKKITGWLKGQEDRCVITFRHARPVGISMGRGASKARDASGVRLVLVRDSKFVGGWRILTGYPEL